MLKEIDTVNSSKNFKKIIKIIKEGGVIIFPTDTVYGLIADATNEKSVEKLFKIKKRPKEKPIPIFVKNIKMAKKFAIINKKQEKILREKWPGKFTFVLKRRKEKIFGVDEKTIALRIPNYKFINILLEKLNRPLTGTSANISNKPASTKIRDILKQFQNQKVRPDLVINSRNLSKNKPSKIIDLTSKKIIILRY